MRRLILTFLCGVLFFSLANAGSEEKREKGKAESAVAFTNLDGLVIEEFTGEPIVGAKIKIVEIGQEIYTDFDGNFSLENVPQGNYTIEISYISFDTFKQENISIDQNHSTLLFELK